MDRQTFVPSIFNYLGAEIGFQGTSSKYLILEDNISAVLRGGFMGDQLQYERRILFARLLEKLILISRRLLYKWDLFC